MDNKSQDNNIFILIKSFFLQMCVYVYVCRQSYQLSITSEQSLLHLRNQVLAAPGFLLHSQIFALSLTNLTIQTRYLDIIYIPLHLPDEVPAPGPEVLQHGVRQVEAAAPLGRELDPLPATRCRRPARLLGVAGGLLLGFCIFSTEVNNKTTNVQS